jgi:hypothetical protein
LPRATHSIFALSFFVLALLSFHSLILPIFAQPWFHFANKRKRTTD